MNGPGATSCHSWFSDSKNDHLLSIQDIEGTVTGWLVKSRTRELDNVVNPKANHHFFPNDWGEQACFFCYTLVSARPKDELSII